jgi:hypothetical protein
MYQRNKEKMEYSNFQIDIRQPWRTSFNDDIVIKIFDYNFSKLELLQQIISKLEFCCY